MQDIEELTSMLGENHELSAYDASHAAKLLASSSVDSNSKREFLIALSEKGETAGEVAAFAGTFRDLAIDPGLDAWAPNAIDVCGTGGDGAHTFNISTCVSFIVASAGVPVFKHGNRSITSKCGSADLLEALGFRLEGHRDLLQASIEALNFTFFFAPAFHPAFKEIMPVRKSLAESGHRSIFNLLGPLINPGRPANQLLGVFSERWVEPLASALHSLGLDSGLVAHCRPEEDKALDELSCAGVNLVAGFGRLRDVDDLPELSSVGLDRCGLDDLKGGDVDQNLKMLHSLIADAGEGVPVGLMDSILLNAGAALWVCSRASDLSEGIHLARELVQSGTVLRWLKSAQDFYAKY